MRQDIEFQKNEDALKLATSSFRRHLAKIFKGGGRKRIDKLHAKGKSTARERINLLLDKDAPFFEIGAFAGHGMYAEYGGCPAGGVIVVMNFLRIFYNYKFKRKLKQLNN